MKKIKAKGIVIRLARIQQELFTIAADFGDVDNYFMSELERASDELGRIRGEIADMTQELSQQQQ